MTIEEKCKKADADLEKENGLKNGTSKLTQKRKK